MTKTAPLKHKNEELLGSACPKEVTRDIKPHVTAMLWGKAAGRCQFAGCNRVLWKSLVTQESVNLAQRAHIYAFRPNGPRGRTRPSAKELNDVGNLMLVCHGCHRKIDKEKDGGRYPARLLLEWKTHHERRVEIVTGIDSTKRSHIVFYGANIGEHSSPLSFPDAASALFPRFYPAEDRPIQLGMHNSSVTDRSAEFWRMEADHLRGHFQRRVRERISDGEIGHLSIFGLAPQPLLALLGSLLIDVTPAAVYQRHREPQTWAWPKKSWPVEYIVNRPTAGKRTPVLVLALSAAVTDSRVEAVLGSDAAIWRITTHSPNTDLIKSEQHLATFRRTIRPLLDEIKMIHGQTTPLHIFPAVSNSVAIEFGRIRMPKAHTPWVIYDQVNGRGGFVPALTIFD